MVQKTAPLLRVKKKSEGVPLPKYETSGIVGMDIKAFIPSDLAIPPMGRVKNGDRIAQMVISPVIRASILEAEDLSQTERGSGRFGSTGT